MQNFKKNTRQISGMALLSIMILFSLINCSLSIVDSLTVIINTENVSKSIKEYQIKIPSREYETSIPDKGGNKITHEIDDLQVGRMKIFVQAIDSEGMIIAKASDYIDVLRFGVKKIKILLKPVDITLPDKSCISSYCWSPDGTEIAVVNYKDQTAWDNDLWIVDYNFENPRLIKAGGVKSIYDWQGNWLLYTRDQQEGIPKDYFKYREGEAWRIKDDGSEENQVTFTYTNGIRTIFWNPSYEQIGTVSWAKFIPGTELIYFIAHDGNDLNCAYICNADDKDYWQKVSTSTRTRILDGAVSPSGKTLYYSCSNNEYTPLQLYSVDVESIECLPITNPREHCKFVILTDEEHIASSAAGRISVMNISNKNEITLINDNTNSSIASRGRNANELLIYSTRADIFQHLYLLDFLNIDDPKITQLSCGSFHDIAATISPNGTYLSYLKAADSNSPYGQLTIVPIPIVARSLVPISQPLPKTLNYAEDFDVIEEGTLPAGWIKADSPADNNFIQVSGPIGPFSTKSLGIIDNHDDMRVIGLNSLETPVNNGIIEFDFYCVAPETPYYDLQFYLSLFDVSEKKIVDVEFISQTSISILMNIYSSIFYGPSPYDPTPQQHLKLSLDNGNASMYIDDQFIHAYSYNPTSIAFMQFLSTNASIGQLYIDNLRILE